jgi:predicted metal-dependent phosphoesterase TrpH
VDERSIREDGAAGHRSKRRAASRVVGEAPSRLCLRHSPFSAFAMIVDFHVHTAQGSADSNLDVFAMIARARAIGLDGVAITEHDHWWRTDEVDEFAREHGVTLFRGMEVTTELGHVGVFGLNGYAGGICRIRELRKVADEAGAFLIANHPFRYKLDPRAHFMHRDLPVDLTPERAAEMDLLCLAEEVEVLNGGCSEEENRFALEAARLRRRPGIGGSDSHDVHSLGCAVTVLERRCSSVAELVAELKAGRYKPAQGLLRRELRVFE